MVSIWAGKWSKPVKHNQTSNPDEYQSSLTPAPVNQALNYWYYWDFFASPQRFTIPVNYCGIS